MGCKFCSFMTEKHLQRYGTHSRKTRDGAAIHHGDIKVVGDLSNDEIEPERQFYKPELVQQNSSNRFHTEGGLDSLALRRRSPWCILRKVQGEISDRYRPDRINGRRRNKWDIEFESLQTDAEPGYS